MKKILFLIFLILAMSTSATIRAAVLTCADSDKGLNYYVAGYAQSSTSSYKYSDRCLTSSRLQEYYCSSVRRVAAFVTVICKNGCKDGACLQPAPDPTPTPNSNLIPNPSLESTNGTAPDSWQSENWGTNNAKFTYPEPGHTGSAASVTITDYTSGDAKWHFKDIPSSPGKEYLFSDFYKATVPTVITVQFTLSNGSFYYTDIGTIPASTDWKQVSYNFTAPLGTASLTIFHLLNSAGSLTVDDYSLQDQTSINSFSQGMISFNFDDGYASAYQNGIPLLNTAGIKSTQYIITSEIGDAGNGYINAEQILDMQMKGHEIESHSITHPDLTILSQDAAAKEISDSKAALENIGVKTINSFSYPFGAWNDSVKQLVKNAGYKGARTGANYPVDVGFNYKNTDAFALKTQVLDKNTPLSTITQWIDQALANKTWLILVMHRVENSSELYNTPPETLRQIINYVKQKNLKTVTNSQGLSLMGN